MALVARHFANSKASWRLFPSKSIIDQTQCWRCTDVRLWSQVWVERRRRRKRKRKRRGRKRGRKRKKKKKRKKKDKKKKKKKKKKKRRRKKKKSRIRYFTVELHTSRDAKDPLPPFLIPFLSFLFPFKHLFHSFSTINYETGIKHKQVPRTHTKKESHTLGCQRWASPLSIVRITCTENRVINGTCTIGVLTRR